MIQPNTQKIYMAPSAIDIHFTHEGRRYYRADSGLCLISDYGKYGMMPPAGRGFYLKISSKEFNQAHAKYLEHKRNFLNALSSGYLKAGGIQAPLF